MQNANDGTSQSIQEYNNRNATSFVRAILTKYQHFFNAVLLFRSTDACQCALSNRRCLCVRLSVCPSHNSRTHCHEFQSWRIVGMNGVAKWAEFQSSRFRRGWNFGRGAASCRTIFCDARSRGRDASRSLNLSSSDSCCHHLFAHMQLQADTSASTAASHCRCGTRYCGVFGSY